jgi:hypothetical protein
VRVIAVLDQVIGPKFSHKGDRFRATIQPGSSLPAGEKIVGRVVQVQQASKGSLSYTVLVVDGIEMQNGEIDRLDARIVGVELLEKQVGGREVGSTGAGSGEVIGSIIPAAKLPPSEDTLRRDPLGKGAIVALGSGEQPPQLDKGARIAIDVASFGERQRVAGSEPVLDLPGLTRGEVIGRTVQLDGVPVESVIGDVVFWIGTSKSDRTLVVIDKMIDTPENAIIVRAGMRVSLSGVVERMPSPELAPRLWKMVSAAEAEELRSHPTYIYANRARVVGP